MSTGRKAAENAKELFELLYETASNAGIEVIEDRINRKGGVCRLQEKLMVVYDANSSLAERSRLIEQLTHAWSRASVNEPAASVQPALWQR